MMHYHRYSRRSLQSIFNKMALVGCCRQVHLLKGLSEDQIVLSLLNSNTHGLLREKEREGKKRDFGKVQRAESGIAGE